MSEALNATYVDNLLCSFSTSNGFRKRRNDWRQSPFERAFIYWLILWSDYRLTAVPEPLPSLCQPGGWSCSRPRQRWSWLLSRRQALDTTRTDHSYSCVAGHFLYLSDVWIASTEWSVWLSVLYSQFFNESHIICLVIYMRTIGSLIEHRFKVSMSAWTGKCKE